VQELFLVLVEVRMSGAVVGWSIDARLATLTTLAKARAGLMVQRRGLDAGGAW
jgi:hypothetical protein